MSDASKRATLLLVASSLLGCSSSVPSPSARLLVAFELAAQAPAPDYLRVRWVGDEMSFRTDRVPAAGNLTSREGPLGTFEIGVRQTGGSRTIVAQGLVGDTVVVEGATLTNPIAMGGDTTVIVTLLAGRLPDDDNDGIPNTVDNCPTMANPTQTACGVGPDARPAPVDAGADTAPDAPPDVAPPDAARDVIPWPVDAPAPSPDLRTPRGGVCVRDADCETDHCAEGQAGRLCADLEMVVVPAGPFTRGCVSPRDTRCADDERPQHKITISAFEIDRTEVTQAAFDLCVQARVCSAPTNFNPNARGLYPVGHIIWSAADAYCRWAGKRLPSEAEWEKAARGPADAPGIYPWGDDVPTCARAQFSSCGLNDTVPVGALAGTSYYGAEDLAGNVAEWVNDLYDASYYSRAPDTDPRGPSSGGQGHVARGGSYVSDASLLRTSNRSTVDRDSATQGFRCARDL